MIVEPCHHADMVRLPEPPSVAAGRRPSHLLPTGSVGSDHPLHRANDERRRAILGKTICNGSPPVDLPEASPWFPDLSNLLSRPVAAVSNARRSMGLTLLPTLGTRLANVFRREQRERNGEWAYVEEEPRMQQAPAPSFGSLAPLQFSPSASARRWTLLDQRQHFHIPPPLGPFRHEPTDLSDGRGRVMEGPWKHPSLSR